MLPIDNILNHLELHLKQNPKRECELNIVLQQIILNSTKHSYIYNNCDYSSKFKIPNKNIYRLIIYLGYTKQQLSTAFQKQWNYPKITLMHNDSYYHILTLICLYGARYNNGQLIKNALTLILFKFWNKIINKSFQYCDPLIMKYVIDNMLTKKHLTRKYSDPASLIMKYFTPTLMKKYVPMIKADSDRTKLFYMQWYVRIKQIFYQNFGPDLNDNGKSKARDGLAVIYYKTIEQQLSKAL